MNDIVEKQNKLIERLPSGIGHTKEVVLYSVSKAIERAAYYGIRGLIVLYMISETIGMTNRDALAIYGWFTLSLLISKILGGVLGDLLIGNKNSIIVGGILQGLGAFVLCIPSSTGIYIGIGLITLGSGFYSPNLAAQFGKLYLNKPKLLDAGFTILYTSINIGALLGVVIIGYIGMMNFTLGFVVGGVLMFISIVFLFFIKERENFKNEFNQSDVGRKIIYILSAAVLVGIFWGVYEIGATGVYTLKVGSSEYSSLLNSISSFFGIALGVIGCLVWTFFYVNRLIKFAVGFIIAAISYGLLLFLPENSTDNYVLALLFSAVLLSLAEIIIAPVVSSIATKNTTPKYLAITFSLVFIPAAIFRHLAGIFITHYYDEPFINFGFSTIIYGVIGVALIVVLVITKRVKPTES